MIFVQKLPTLEPEMRDALRCHIMRKRQRLKQELEQDAIEKRLRREKEMKQLQDAMTLDQIKEQLSNLEKRLESLKDEKHHLFNQLKQVLNEDSTRRRQHEVGLRKNGTEETPSQVDNTGPAPVTNHNASQVDHNPSAQDINMKQPFVKSEQPRFNAITTNQSHAGTIISQTNPTVTRSPPVSVAPAYPIPVSMARPIFNNKPIASDMHTPLGAPLASPMPDLIAPHALNYSQHVMFQHPNQRPLLMEVPGRATNPHDPKNVASGNKRSLSAANFNEDLILDRSWSRKKPNNYIYSNPHQFLTNGMPHDLPHGLPTISQCNPLAQHTGLQPTLAMPVPSSSPSFVQSNLHSRKPVTPHHLTSLDYIALLNQGKPGIVLPNLVHPQFYSHPAHLIQPGPLYPVSEPLHQDFNHFNTSYASIAQQYGNAGRATMPFPNQQEHSSQYIAASNHQRKPSSTKNAYYHNK